uniref:MAK10-like protein n=1 Tax=Tanacetum cinerariifolium TaxID=118510 RepID=A0A6L2MA44_TANCI|nr:hypothetical protein [Tanacetum cinerariifolium]
MADKEKKSAMKGFTTNDQADYCLGITSITVNGKNAYDLKGKFLDDLHNNAFSGTNGEDAVEHIEYFLKVVDPIDLPNKLGSNEVDPKNEKTFNLKETGQDDEQEIDEIFRIESNLFDYKTPMSLHSRKNAPLPRFRMVRCFDELKEEALRNKVIMEGLINEDVESNNEGWKSWDEFESTNNDRNEWEYKNEHEDDERYELYGNETHEFSVCIIRRFEMIKYSFGQHKECVAVRENEYKDLTSTSEDACREYQEIFRMMDEGWMVARTE